MLEGAIALYALIQVKILSNLHMWSVCYEGVITVCLPSLILPGPFSVGERVGQAILGRSEYRHGCW